MTKLHLTCEMEDASHCCRQLSINLTQWDSTDIISVAAHDVSPVNMPSEKSISLLTEVVCKCISTSRSIPSCLECNRMFVNKVSKRSLAVYFDRLCGLRIYQ